MKTRVQNWRPFVVAIALVVITLTWIATDHAERAAQIEPRTEREMAIKNSVRIDNLEHEIQDLKEWRNEHTRADALQFARLGQVEQEAGAHEKYFGLAVVALLTSLGALTVSLLTRRSHRARIEELVNLKSS